MHQILRLKFFAPTECMIFGLAGGRLQVVVESKLTLA
jgi:hypothetical protein